MEGVDDWDKVLAFDVGEAPRRSTSLLEPKMRRATNAISIFVVLSLAMGASAAIAASAGPFVLPAGSPSPAKAVICDRSSLVPALHDDKVVLAGYPFAIASAGKSGRRVLWLEMAKGKFQVSYDPGALTRDEQVAVQSRMNEFQNRVNLAPSAGAGGGPHE